MTFEPSKPNPGLASESPNRLIFQYVIASGDMRFIERTERSVVIVVPDNGDWFIRGEVVDCGTECHTTLAQIFLEYLMSCEGCGDQEELDQAIALFSDRVSKAVVDLVTQFQNADELRPLAEQALAGLIRSMDTPDLRTNFGGQGDVTFEYCPICRVADSNGFRRGLDSAHTLLIQTVRKTLAPFHFQAIVDDRDPWDFPEHRLSFRIQQE